MARPSQGAVLFTAMSGLLLVLSVVQVSGLCPPGLSPDECRKLRHDIYLRRTLISELLNRRDLDPAELDDKTLERALDFLRGQEEEEERDSGGETVEQERQRGSPLEREAQDEEGDLLRSFMQRARDQKEAERKKELERIEQEEHEQQLRELLERDEQEEKLRELLEQILAD